MTPPYLPCPTRLRVLPFPPTPSISKCPPKRFMSMKSFKSFFFLQVPSVLYSSLCVRCSSCSSCCPRPKHRTGVSWPQYPPCPLYNPSSMGSEFPPSLIYPLWSQCPLFFLLPPYPSYPEFTPILHIFHVCLVFHVFYVLHVFPILLVLHIFYFLHFLHALPMSF